MCLGLLTTGSPQTFADRLAVLNYIAGRNAQEVAGVAVLRDRYAADLQRLELLVAQQRKQDAELAAKKGGRLDGACATTVPGRGTVG
jgi:hypothetical protein